MTRYYINCYNNSKETQHDKMTIMAYMAYISDLSFTQPEQEVCNHREMVLQDR